MVTEKRPSYIYRRAHAIGRKPNGVSPTPRMKKEADCEISRECGACAFINRPYRDGLREKFEAGIEILRKSEILGDAVVVPATESPSELGSRAFAKLAVRECSSLEKTSRRVVKPHRPRFRIRTDDDMPGAPGQQVPAPEAPPPSRRFAIGIFKPRTHDIVSLLRCPLHTHIIRRLLFALQTALDGSPLRPYDERTGSGDVRYVAIRTAHLTEEVMITFVVKTPCKAELRKIVNDLRTKDQNITSAHMNIHPDNSNAIFGAKTEIVAGTERMREKLCELEFEISPTAFFQVNPWQAENIYRRIEMIAGECDNNTPAWDLYCGAGIISLILGRAGYRVFGVEENPKAIEDAAHNANLNHLIAQTTFAAGLVENMIGEMPAWAANPQLIVVNPSRRGMADSVRARLAGHMVQHPETRLVYMSCEVETLARDLKDICAAGFRLRQIEAFDMFPQTNNVEWLAVVTK